MTKKRRMTIAEIEVLLNREEECEFEILPNGEIRQLGGSKADGKKLKPITLGENLGGEYSLAA